MKNCESCALRGEAFFGCCYVPWCPKRDEPISFPLEEGKLCPDFE